MIDLQPKISHLPTLTNTMPLVLEKSALVQYLAIVDDLAMAKPLTGLIDFSIIHCHRVGLFILAGYHLFRNKSLSRGNLLFSSS